MAEDIIRRLVGRTIAQQLAPAVERATAPFQHALTTRAGCECICRHKPRQHSFLIDGIGAFDLVSREAMLRGFSAEGGEAVLPFVRQFYGAPSMYLWQDDSGVTHEFHQGEGGEQGDALMPALFSLGQHPALVAVQTQFGSNCRLLAFLDDIYARCSPDRVIPIFNSLRRELWYYSRIQICFGKTQLWNQGGAEPAGWEALRAPGSCQLRVAPFRRVWLQTRLHNVLGLGLLLTVARQRTAQRDVDCQLSTEAREILGQNLNASCVSGGHSDLMSRRIRTCAPTSAPRLVRWNASLLHPACSHARRSVVAVNVHRRTATFTNRLSDGKG